MIRSVLPYAFAGLAFAGPAPADSDHDLARSALARGEIIALSDLLPDLEAQLNARLIDAEIEREDGALVYEIVLITADGRLVEVVLDATTGTVLDQTGRRHRRRAGHSDDSEDDD